MSVLPAKYRLRTAVDKLVDSAQGVGLIFLIKKYSFSLSIQGVFMRDRLIKGLFVPVMIIAALLIRLLSLSLLQ